LWFFWVTAIFSVNVLVIPVFTHVKCY
jgi:hypothetical protein